MSNVVALITLRQLALFATDLQTQAAAQQLALREGCRPKGGHATDSLGRSS
jgi:hypothetical protein